MLSIWWRILNVDWDETFKHLRYKIIQANRNDLRFIKWKGLETIIKSCELFKDEEKVTLLEISGIFAFFPLHWIDIMGFTRIALKLLSDQ